MGNRHPNVTNLDEMPWNEGSTHGTRIGYRDKWCADEAGGKQLGASFYEVEPGKTAFPHHAHLVNEEAIYVLDGEGTLRLGDQKIPVRAGDYIALLAGLDHPHQLVNTGAATLRYLCMSTRRAPEIAIYPDAGKLGVLGGEAIPIREMYFRKDARTGSAAYFEGEPEE
jgi:uncharacterized cupin superfamily protein